GANTAHSHDHRALADPNELAHRSLAAQKTVVADADMTTDHGIIGEGNVAADFAIMGHVGTGHEKATIADFGHAAVVLGARVEGYALPDSAVSPDRTPARPAAILDRLRRRAERGEWVDDCARPDGGVTGDMDVGHEAAPLAHHDVRADDAVWTN